jgi:hypothetical protein
MRVDSIGRCIDIDVVLEELFHGTFIVNFGLGGA